MYKSSFGILAPPFQLTPDPGMYFDSDGHHQALLILRRAIHETTSGFSVVSGEIGAGKTMVARTLIAELDRAVFEVALVVSSQLDADELLAAVSIGFGIDPLAAAAERADERLPAFFAALEGSRRRAVVVVDEAHHLSPSALERLVDLCAPGGEPRFPVQVWLIGQPELHALIDGPGGLRLRRSMRASCHIGPIAVAETGPYIECRLRKVGWHGRPSFDTGVFEAIFRHTQGIPRRINLLCNRLLLSRFLAAATTIDLQTVAEAVRELAAESAGHDAADLQAAAARTLPIATAASVTPTAQDRHKASAAGGPPRHRLPVLSDALRETGAPLAPRRLMPQRPFMCVVADESDHIKAAGLIRAMAGRLELPPATLLRVHDNDALACTGALYADFDIERRLERMSVPFQAAEVRGYDLMTAFDTAFRRLKPAAVAVFDGSAVAFACSTVARARNVPVVHIGAGLRVPGAVHLSATRASTDALADRLFTADQPASRTLLDEGIAAEKVECVGSLAFDGVHVAMRLIAARAACPSRQHAPGRTRVDDPRGYALVVLGNQINILHRIPLTDIMGVLVEVSRVIPLVWPTRTQLHTQLKKFALRSFVEKDRMRCIPAQLYVDYVALLRKAKCVVTDSWNVQEEARGLGIPSLSVGAFPERFPGSSANVPVGTNRALALSALWDLVLKGADKATPEPLWDGHSGARIAGRLGPWLAGSN